MKGPGYLAVEIQPGPETNEKLFQEWYNTEHGPLRLRLPEILNGHRYKAIDGQKPEWSACYDTSDLSLFEKRIYTRLREERSQREAKVMGSFESLDRKIWSLFSTRGSTPDATDAAPVQFTVNIRLNESDLEEFDNWYEGEHIDMLGKIPGWLRTRRFRMEVGGLRGMPPPGQVECLAVHDFTDPSGATGDQIKASADTALSKKVLGKIVSMDARIWAHHLTFDALSEPPSTFITTDGAQLRWQMEGDPSAPVVVFVNSILTNLHIWDDLAKKLTTTGINGQTYRVLRYNPRNYVDPEPRSNPANFNLLADDLEYLLQRLNITQAHAVIGVSMGGVTALNFAIRHPDMLRKFVACDCNVASSPANNSAWAERIALARSGSEGLDKLANATVKRWFTPANHDSEAAKNVEHMIARASVDGFEQMAGALCDYDLKPKLREIKVPGLLVAGEGDGKLPEVMKGFGIPGTETKVVPGAGHLPMTENVDGFMKTLEGFL